MVPDGWAAADFVFNYGAFFIFSAILIAFKAYEVFGKRRPFQVYIKAQDIDLETDLRHIEELTAASEAQRASKPRRKGQKVSDFFF
jgi:amino acid permease